MASLVSPQRRSFPPSSSCTAAVPPLRHCTASPPPQLSSFLYSFLFLFIPAATTLHCLRLLRRSFTASVFSTTSSFPLVHALVSTPQISGNFCFGCMFVVAFQMYHQCSSVIGPLHHPANDLPLFKRHPVICFCLLLSILGFLIRDDEIWGFRVSTGIGLCSCESEGFGIFTCLLLVGVTHRRLRILLQQLPVLQPACAASASSWSGSVINIGSWCFGFDRKGLPAAILGGSAPSACRDYGVSASDFLVFRFSFCFVVFGFSLALLVLVLPLFLRLLWTALVLSNESITVIVSKFLKATIVLVSLVSRVVLWSLVSLAPFYVLVVYFVLVVCSLLLGSSFLALVGNGLRSTLRALVLLL